MSHSAILQAVLYATEASFCEVSSTFGTALPLIDTVDLSGLGRERQAIPHMRQYLNEGYDGILMPFEGKTIKLRGRVAGLGATAAGAVPSSDLWTFLGLGIGNIASGLATGTTFTGGTAAVPTTTAANGAAAGALVHGGAVVDGRVGGQWLVVGDHSSSNLTLLLAGPVAPNNADVLYASKNVYPTEAGGEVPGSFRMRVLTSNGHFNLRGCFFMGGPRLTGTNPGEIPEWEADVCVSHFETASATFPSATVAQRHSGAPSLVNGSFAYAAVGATTRSTEAVRSLAINLDLACEGLKGPGGNYEGQIYQAVRRTKNSGTLEVVVDQETTGTYTWWDRHVAAAQYYAQILISMSVADGRAWAFYASNARLDNVTPVADGGYNRWRLMFSLLKGGTDTTALTRSAWRIGVA